VACQIHSNEMLQIRVGWFNSESRAYACCGFASRTGDCESTSLRRNISSHGPDDRCSWTGGHIRRHHALPAGLVRGNFGSKTIIFDFLCEDVLLETFFVMFSAETERAPLWAFFLNHPRG
jgi:hypothetical protein